MAASRARSRRVPLLIAGTALAAAGALALSLGLAGGPVGGDSLTFGVLLALTLVLQTFSVRLSSQGSISVSSLGVLAAAFLLGPAPAMLIAIVAAVAQWIRRRGLFHRAVFDASNFALAAATGAATFEVLTSGPAESQQVVASAVAGAAYCVVNTGLLCVAMGLSEGRSPLAVWSERFRWATPYYLVAGPLAFVAVLAHGGIGIVAFALLAAPYAAALIAHRRLVPAAAA